MPFSLFFSAFLTKRIKNTCWNIASLEIIYLHLMAVLKEYLKSYLYFICFWVEKLGCANFVVLG